MTERLAEVSARIGGLRQLGSVVNAMRGMAAARARQARSQLTAVEAYSATIAGAIGSALALIPDRDPDPRRGAARPALALFVAEQGFAGAFSERVLDAAAPELAGAELYLVGDRGAMLAAERGVSAQWKSAMPSHSQAIPKFADGIVNALFERIAAGNIDRLDALFNRQSDGQGLRVERRRLFPLDYSRFKRAEQADPPLTYLPPQALLEGLTSAYLHAELCDVALHAFAAENEARREAMTRTHRQIDQRLDALLSRQRIVRQEEITAEIIELAAGVSASGVRG